MHAIRAGEALQPQCKECIAERGKKWQKNNRDKILLQRVRREQREDPEVRRKYREEYFQKNKDKIRIRNKEFRDANLEKVRLRYIASIHKRRANGCDKRDAEVIRAVDAALESYRIGSLYWDVYDSRLIRKPTVDHIVPVTSGGTNDVENLTVTSSQNNSSKNSLPLILWMLKRRQREDAN